MIKAFWEKLDKKQRYMVAGAAAFVFIVFFFEVIISPFSEAKTRLERNVVSNQLRLQEMVQLDAEFTRQNSRMAAMKQVMSSRTADFSLFSYLEKKAAQAGVKGNIKYMNTVQPAPSAAFEEALIDIGLEKITIKQLADFLYFVESPGDLVRVKRINVIKMREDPQYLSAQMQVSSIVALTPSRRGN
ncbi:MAG TPA: hypothetical protein ENN23_02565 [Deltaproteobacteria bacterium]|nr:hypothetical protein [Deltaproteobacteria bacterium]